MIAKEVTISSKTGLESKMAARLIQKASSYEANIWIQKVKEKQMQKACWGSYPLVLVREIR